MKAMLAAYGSFLLLPGPVPAVLLIAATLVEPVAGISAIVAGLAALGARRLLPLPPGPSGLELVNALLVGHLVGATWAPSPVAMLLLLSAGPLTVVLTLVLHERCRPLLCAPFVCASFVLLAAAHALLLPLAPLTAPLVYPWAPWLQGWLRALGGIFLCPNVISGALVALAVGLGSPYLLGLSLLAFACNSAWLLLLGVPGESWTHVFAGTQAILSALMVAGLWLTPGLPSLLLGLLSGLASSLLYVALADMQASLHLPPLALPFLLTTWACLALARPTGGFWSFQRLAQPSLPHVSGERCAQAQARGLDATSVALRAPFQGTWHVYQSFDGPYTHQGPWRYGLDFYQVVDGRSFRQDGARLQDYLCYGQLVTAPVAGVVVACRGDIPDNQPGEVDLQHRWGNHVILHAAHGAYVLLAHLQNGTLAVKKGQFVELGQGLARCGNSGRSPQPHLHIQVQRDGLLGSATVPFHLSHVITEGSTYSLHSRPDAGTSVCAPAQQPALSQALHLPVGRRLIYRSGSELRSVEVELDVLGVFWLRSDRGARVAFVESRELLAFYDRCATRDPFLDALTLALGVTPFAHGDLEWRDAPAARLCGASHWWPWNNNLQSVYHRRLDSPSGHWRQDGSHGECTTWAEFSPHSGLVAFGLRSSRGGALEARLDQVGLREDGGIPGWQCPVAEQRSA